MDEKTRRLLLDPKALRKLIRRFKAADPQALQVELGLFALANKKARMIHLRADREIDAYKAEDADIRQKIADAEQRIVDLTLRISEAETVRSQKLEYDAIAKDLVKYPSVESSSAKIDAIKLEIDAVTQACDGLDKAVDLRKEAFERIANAVCLMHDLIASRDEMHNIFPQGRIFESNDDEYDEVADPVQHTNDDDDGMEID